MYPSITVFGKDLGLYMILSTIGILVAGAFCVRNAKKRHLDDNDFILILVAFGVGLVIGGHLLFGITNIKKIIFLITHLNIISSFRVLLGYLNQIFGGSVFYGGLIGGLISSMIYCKWKKYNFNNYKDILTLAVPLFHGFGRIGCFLGGCCYGVESHFGFVFHDSLAKGVNGVRRFPIQLVEALFCFILFFILYKILFNNKKYQNKLLYYYFITYPVGRFIFEFFRGDTYRGFLFGLSTSQIISVLLVIYGIIKLFIYKKKELKKV